jgi:glycosyltransferase 2 family protein
MKQLLRIGLTLALLAWLVTMVDLSGVTVVLARTRADWMILAALVNLSTMALAAWRWNILLAGMGLCHPFRDLLRISFVSTFFSLFLPSSVSGDVMKMVLLAPGTRQRETVISSVLLDRIVGMAVSNLIGLVAVLCSPSVWHDATVVSTIAVVIGVFSIGVLALFSPATLALARWVAPAWLWLKLGGSLEKIHSTLLRVRERPRVLLGAMAIGALRQLMICLSIYCAGQAMGIAAGPVVYFAMVPIALAITALPIAINGLGLQDNALIVLLGAMGVVSAEALSLSLFIHAMRYALGLIGGALFAAARRAPARAPLVASPVVPQPEG